MSEEKGDEEGNVKSELSSMKRELEIVKNKLLIVNK